MESYLQIGKVNLKHNLFPHLIITFAFSLLAPLLMGFEGLDEARVAQVLEFYVVLVGIILLIPIFLPDQDKDIKELIMSKYTSMVKIHLIRLAEALIFLAVTIAVFIIILYNNNPVFPPMTFFLGAMADAVFLGGLGILAYSIFDNIALAYMLPVIYYVMNYSGNKYLQKFYLFSMVQGSFEEKIYMGIGGVICIVIGILYRQRKV